MKINELVQIDQHGEFVSAVQLHDYYNPNRNNQLIKSFIFSESGLAYSGLNTHYYGSIDLLDFFRQSFLSLGKDNVFVVLADYGHGKSHFALELMNYFERPYKSQETKIVLERITAALPNHQDRAGNFETFKKEKDRFLVLSLSGDSGKTIQEMLYASLIQTLASHPETKEIKLPLWNESAVDWLKNQTEDINAKKFLSSRFKTDIPNLISDVENNKNSAWEQYRALVKEISGITPASEGNMNPQQVINWLIHEFVGPGKPFGGLVVFFDEFSQFIRVYSNRLLDGDLGILLMAIQENKQKALLVALGHNDPIEVARVYTRANETSFNDISKDLTRIERKLNLYSLVESIMDSFLSNSRAKWSLLFQENRLAKGAFFGEIAETSWELYKKRYEQELRWDYDKYLEVVVYGCFPLHPTTTGLLASLKMVSHVTDDARSLLRFVREVYDRKKNEEIMEGPRVNWVYPIELVDFFNEKIADITIYSEYLAAKNNLDTHLGEKATDLHRNLLKALLLQRVENRMDLRGFHQTNLLSHYCGLVGSDIVFCLKELSEANVLKFERGPQKYIFYQVGVDFKALEEKVKRELATKKFDRTALYQLVDVLHEDPRFSDALKEIEINLDWGHPAEWAVSQVILTRENFTAEELNKLIPRVKFGPSAVKQPVKGMIVWCMALMDEDVTWFKEKAKEILNSAFQNKTPPPFLVILPEQSHEEIADYFLRYQVLKELLRSGERRASWDEQINTEIAKYREYLMRELKDHMFSISLRNISQFETSKEYEGTIKANIANARNMQEILGKLILHAYPIRPRYFFNDLKGFGSSKLTIAAKKIIGNLAQNNLADSLNANQPTAIESRLTKYLSDHWKILSNSNYVKEPDDNNILKPAWDYLDKNIVPDQNEVRLRDILPILMEAPYGFDFNTTMLLFAAWVGFHKKELHFSKLNREVTLKYFFENIVTGKPAISQTMNELCFKDSGSIRRESIEAIETEIRATLQLFQNSKSLSKKKANEILVKIRDYFEKERGTGNPIEKECQVVITSIEIVLKEYGEYETQIRSIIQEINNTNDLKGLLKLESNLKELKSPDLIESEQPDIKVIQEKLDECLQNLVERFCRSMSQLNNIEEAGNYRTRIEEYRKILGDRLDLMQNVNDAERELNKRVKELRFKLEEDSIKEKIEFISDDTKLVKLKVDLNYLMKLDLPEKFYKLRDAKAEKLQNRIKEYDNFAKTTIGTYQSISEKEFRSFKEKLISQLAYFEGSEYQDQLKSIREYLDSLERYSQTIRTLPDMNSGNIESLKKGLRIIGELKSTYIPVFSESHSNWVITLEERFTENLEEKISNVTKEVETLEDLLDLELKDVSKTLDIEKQREKITFLRSSNLEKVNLRLDQAENKLKKIETEMNERHTIEQIKILFKKLDATKKAECLLNLKNM